MALTTARLDFAEERGRLLRFLVVGAANTGLSYAVYAGGLSLGLSYQLASLVALLVGIATGFVLQGKVAFKAQLKGRFLPFLGLWSLLYLANIVAIDAIAFFGLNYYWAGLLAAVPVNIISFVALRSVIFADRKYSMLCLALIWCLGLAAVARLHVVTHLAPNWDEFLNLSMVYDYRRGEMTEIFQTGFIHLFRWLPYISGNEVDQVIGARFIALLCAGITSWAIYHASRRFMPVESALVAVLAFNTFGYSLLYGTDFRTDTLATAAMMSAAALATRPALGMKTTIGVGMLMAIGGVLTIKSVFFVPTIGILLLTASFTDRDPWRSSRILLAGAAVSLLVFATILLLHASGLQDKASAVAFIGRTGGATLLTGDYTIAKVFALPVLLRNVGMWFLFACGVGALIAWKRPRHRAEQVALAAFILPAMVPLIYSEVYPYYHPFIIAPLCVVAGFGFHKLMENVREGARPVAGFAVIAMMVGFAALSFFARLDGKLAEQRATLALVHAIFPQAVPYIDHASMVSSYPKQGIFMSAWGMKDYRAVGQPIMRQVIAEHQPRFMLETRTSLAVDAMSPEESEQSPTGLLAEDVRSLRDNYARYWGPLFLPAKSMTGSSTMELLIGGRYRIESPGPVKLGGRTLRPGDAIDLKAGRYPYSLDGKARLVWDAPPPPTSSPPDNLFTGW
ncbi:GtrA family protein [Aurantiacibacter rhizosphaerae]|uniref:GtrA-like protein domain-containing protein n=1 Tax=Aurantiacibacter rhizosphaerae TaxID=2691582 RepID=A0A844X8I5_9SPHN|nr:GtrA family protein [Aurantiacibacter rhizosphaerae]MWV26691.1 hypothetical protein [Aurantiacibacter rhizosphaerae]